MTRGEAQTATPVVLDASTEALAQHDQEMNDYLNSSDDLDGGNAEEVERALRRSVEMEEYLHSIDMLLAGDDSEWMSFHVFTHEEEAPSERVQQIRTSIVDTAQKAYYFAADNYHDAKGVVSEKTSGARQAWAENRAETRAKRDEKRTENAKDPNDKIATRTRKALGRSTLWLQEKAPKAAAAFLVGATLLTVSQGSELLDNKRETQTQVAADATPERDQAAYELRLAAKQSVLVVGGAGQGEGTLILEEFQGKGYVTGGAEAQKTQYTAEIGPFVGTQRMDVSTQAGAATMFNQYKQLSAAGKDVELVGFSEGTRVTYETAWMIYRDNGNKWPENVTVTMVGGPYQQGGLFDHPFIDGISPFIDAAGVPTNRQLPPGANIEFVYYDRDIYANGGNQLTTTLIFNIFTLGAHAVPDMTKETPAYTFTDSEGFVHKVYSSDQLLIKQVETALGIKIHDTQSAMLAINAFFPQAMYPGQEVRPDFRKGLMYTAVALDHQIAAQLGLPPESVSVLQDLVAALPDEWKELGQVGMDGFNKIADTAGKMMNGQIDPLTGASIIMSEFMKITQGVMNVLPDNFDDGVDTIQNIGIDVLASQIQKNTGYDARPQLQQMMDVLEQGVENFLAQNPNIAQPQNSGEQLPFADMVNTALQRVQDQRTPDSPFYTAPADSGIQLEVIPPSGQPLPATIPNEIIPPAANEIPEPQAPAVTVPVPAPTYDAPASQIPTFTSEPAPIPAPAPPVVEPEPPRVETPPPVQEPAWQPPVWQTPAPAPAPAPAPIPEPAPEPPRVELPPPPPPAPVAPAPLPQINFPQILPQIDIPSGPSSGPAISFPDLGSSSSDGSSGPAVSLPGFLGN